jgi:hypothetical protein
MRALEGPPQRLFFAVGTGGKYLIVKSHAGAASRGVATAEALTSSTVPGVAGAPPRSGRDSLARTPPLGAVSAFVHVWSLLQASPFRGLPSSQRVKASALGRTARRAKQRGAPQDLPMRGAFLRRIRELASRARLVSASPRKPSGRVEGSRTRETPKKGESGSDEMTFCTAPGP